MSLAASPLGLAAAGFYVLVIVATGRAAMIAQAHAQQQWHRRRWTLLALLFAALAVSRIFSVEDLLRDFLRDLLRSENAYAARRDFQSPIAAGVLAIAALAGLGWSVGRARKIRGRRNLAVEVASLAGLGMVLLALLRLVSFHPVDVLLYGSLKLNWITDLGLSGIVAGAGAFYARVVRQ